MSAFGLPPPLSHYGIPLCMAPWASCSAPKVFRVAAAAATAMHLLSLESNEVKPDRDGEVSVERRLRFLILDRARRELFAAGGRVGPERKGSGRVGLQTLKGSC